ncbi:MAG TPA: YHYH protein, partial [Thiothrix sp.]|nr:YHYH protein [Thiothrix sp.]
MRFFLTCCQKACAFWGDSFQCVRVLGTLGLGVSLFMLSACQQTAEHFSSHTINDSPQYFQLGNPSVDAVQAQSGHYQALATTVNPTPTEGDVNSTTVFSLQISAAMSSAASVTYETRAITATSGTDFIATSGTATIPAGSTEALINVEIVGDDLAEENESFQLVITNPTGGIFPSGVTEMTATRTIIDDDSGSTDITNAILSNRSGNCADYVKQYTSSVKDVKSSVAYAGDLTISVANNKCSLKTNEIPNHDFNDGNANFVGDVTAQNSTYEVTANPSIANRTTALSLSIDNGLFLNGVKLDLIAAACYNVGNEMDGCFDMSQPWRFDPMSPLTQFGTDSHNAHSQPDGSYHYHGNPNALFTSDQATLSPVIGFAADGFPIYGSYFDDNGTIRKATASYQLKSGSRTAINGINPSGTYDGTYIDDYEYVANSGDLDECN